MRPLKTFLFVIFIINFYSYCDWRHIPAPQKTNEKHSVIIGNYRSGKIFELPVEVLARIAHFCDWRSVSAMQKTCTLMHKYFYSPKKVIPAYFCFKLCPEQSKALFNFLQKAVTYIQQRNGRNAFAVDLRRNMLCSGQLREIIEELEEREFADKIVELNVASNRLHKMPSNLSCLSALRRISLWENGTSPGALALIAQRLPQLTSLRIGCNNLLSIPPQLPMLTKLRELSISGNTFESEALKVIAQFSTLQKLCCTRCYLWELPKEFVKLKELRTIEVSINHLDTNALRILCSLTKLQYLNIAINNVRAFPEQMRNLVNLQTLRADENEIDPLSVEYISRLPLQVVTLDSNELNRISHTIMHMRGLQRLSLQKNQFSESVQKAIRYLLPKSTEVKF